MTINDGLRAGDLVEVRWRPAGTPRDYSTQRGIIIDELMNSDAKTGVRFYTVLLSSGEQKLCADLYLVLLQRHNPDTSGAGQPL